MLKNPYSRLATSEKERLLEELLPMVKHLAYKLMRGCEGSDLLEDLMQAGIVGLLEAIEKYDPGRGIRLNTYAYMRIKGAMIDEMRARDFFTRAQRSKNKRIEEAIRALSAKLGRHPEEEEVANFLGLTMEEYLEMLRQYRNLHVVSLEEVSELFDEDKEALLMYALEEKDIRDLAEMRDMERILGKEIERLPEKQRLVLTLYYYEDLNMKEIAKVLGISEARVSQLHAQAILNLRTVMEKHLGKA
jgi:RNA polymerase sigma factor for flagellar operon FliA